ncbi:MAG: hypothetical protein ABIP97_10350 [Chthoniobacterales bacterium]
MSKTTLTIMSATAVIFIMAACAGGNHKSNAQKNHFGYGANGAQKPATDASPTPTPDTQTLTEATPSPTPAASPAATTSTLQYGTPVAGKPGFVTSPYSPYSGYVDVRGFPPGQEVKDPYTGKIFLVP